MEKISWTDHVRNEEVLLRVNEQRNILHEIRKRKSNWFGHILRRNCLLKQVIEGKIKREMEVASRRGRRRKKLLYDLNLLKPNDMYIYIYIIYMSYRSAKLQTLHFKYLFNKYTY